MSEPIHQLEEHSQLCRPVLATWIGTLAMIGVLATPQPASADTSDLSRGVDRVFFVAEVLFPDVRGEWDDRGGS